MLHDLLELNQIQAMCTDSAAYCNAVCGLAVQTSAFEAILVDKTVMASGRLLIGAAAAEVGRPFRSLPLLSQYLLVLILRDSPVTLVYTLQV
eukprot:g77235.t1